MKVLVPACEPGRGHTVPPVDRRERHEAREDAPELVRTRQVGRRGARGRQHREAAAQLVDGERQRLDQVGVQREAGLKPLGPGLRIALPRVGLRSRALLARL